MTEINANNPAPDIAAQRAAFADKIRVSHETMAKLDSYAAMLEEWNQKFNLVAESTLPQIWQRHFLDSAQLTRFMPPDSKSYGDIGTGAGFPGLVLAILGLQNMHLIESNGKKISFLREVVSKLELPVTIHHKRVEDCGDLKCDVVTARAVTVMKDLLPLSQRILRPGGACIFMKGRMADAELTESRKAWTFDLVKMPSLSDESGSILILQNIRYKNAASHKFRKRT